jgi:L-alanine-DL-glutamate epimerase-like enolase superfamily enzyme
MKIASFEVVPYALPFRAPYVTATGTLTRREMVLLRLRDAEGLVGLGEAVPLSLRGGATSASSKPWARPISTARRCPTRQAGSRRRPAVPC